MTEKTKSGLLRSVPATQGPSAEVTYTESEMAYRVRSLTGDPLDCGSAVLLNGREYPCLCAAGHPPPHECVTPFTQQAPRSVEDQVTITWWGE